MAKKTTLDDRYTMRANSKMLQRFRRYCESKLKRPDQEVTREMMQAMTEGRLKITPTEDQKQANEDIYS